MQLQRIKRHQGETQNIISLSLYFFSSCLDTLCRRRCVPLAINHISDVTVGLFSVEFAVPRGVLATLALIAIGELQGAC